MKISLILTTIFTFIFSKNLTNISHASSQSPTNNYDVYTHQSNAIIVRIYNTTINTCTFKLIAQHIQHFPNNKITKFIQPNITIFNVQNIATWKITSNQAILNNEKKILYLQGYIYINNLSQNTYFSSMLTNQLKINLLNNDILSNTTVILHGHCFYSISTKMYGNLHTQTIQLVNNTKTYYEIQHIKQ